MYLNKQGELGNYPREIFLDSRISAMTTRIPFPICTPARAVVLIPIDGQSSQVSQTEQFLFVLFIRPTDLYIVTHSYQRLNHKSTIVGY